MKANNIKTYISGLLLIMLILSATLASAQNRATTNSTTTGTSSYSGATNLIVDYDNTGLDTDLQQGESGVLTLTIKNVGGQPANNIFVWLPTVGSLNIDKRFTVGTMDSGESKSLQTTVRVSNNASLGLHIIQARLTYDGFTSSGVADDNLGVTLEIPVRVYGNPAFQVTPEKTTYYLDSIDGLTLEVSVKDAVKDLKTTLSSNGFTVIGSSQKQVGDVGTNQLVTLEYDIKPTTGGSCDATLDLSYKDAAGQAQTSTIMFGLNIEDAGVDFKILNISYDTTGPGEKVAVKTTIKNVGKASAEDVTVELTLADPFTTADTAEKYIGTVKGGETVDETFNLAISWDAETAVYSVPMNISYKVGGSSYSTLKDIGIDVGGEVILKVIEVDSSGSSLKIDVANIGTRTADSVLGTLIIGNDAVVSSSSSSGSSGSSQRTGQGGNPMSMLTGGRPGNTNTQATSTDQSAQSPAQGTGNSTTTKRYISYKSDIKATKQTTFTFDTMISGTATLELEYTGANNKRITQRIPISVGSATTGLSYRTMAARGGTDTTTYILYGVGTIVVLFAGYKLYKRRKNK